MRVWIAIFTLVGLSFARMASAEKVPDLYIAEVPVQNQGKEERQLAVSSALSSVLVRVSGRDLVLTVPKIEAALTLPTRFVQRFRYVKREDGGANKTHLWVRFDEQAVNKLLRDNALPVWGKTRPMTLLWLVVDDRRSRVLISNDRDAQARFLVESQGRLRGLPISLPLYDLADRAKIGVSDVWGNFEDRILEASSRYQPEAVLVGRVFKTYGNKWSGRWTLYSEGRRQDWESNGANLQLALSPGVSHTAEILAQRYAQSDENEEDSQVMVRINGVGSLQAYNKASTYLDSLDVVSQVQPYEVNPDSVVFELTSRRGRLSISQAIALGHTLVAQAEVPRSTPPAVLPGPTGEGANAPAGEGANAPAGEEVKATDPVAPLTIDLSYRLVP